MEGESLSGAGKYSVRLEAGEIGWSSEIIVPSTTPHLLCMATTSNNLWW